MASLVRCKACGYIMDGSKVKDSCPACGLPKTVFEPYNKKISPGRKLLLDQHIHPVAVHFPQVLLFLAAFMPLCFMAAGEPYRSEFAIIAKWSILALPWTVLLGFVTGLMDGKMRFKKLGTPLLIRKMVAGIIFQVLSFVIFAVYCLYGFAGQAPWLIVVLSVVSLPFAIYLGKAGSSLFTAVMPG
jgi:uncharacterized membrane protein/rubredoxin